MTQAELAEKIGVDQTAVSQWETGQTYPKASLLPKIAEVLNCTLDEMFKKSVDNQSV
jgi:transcriptional regulator with XRE-family HTH domain